MNLNGFQITSTVILNNLDISPFFMISKSILLSRFAFTSNGHRDHCWMYESLDLIVIGFQVLFSSLNFSLTLFLTNQLSLLNSYSE